MFKFYKIFSPLFFTIVLLSTANSAASSLEKEKLWNASFGYKSINMSNTCSNPEQDFAVSKESRLTYKIVDAENKTFGYEIFSDEKIIIRQLSKPGLPGNEGFKAKADAEKVARLVIQKIKKGELPPALTIEELKKLNVI